MATLEKEKKGVKSKLEAKQKTIKEVLTSYTKGGYGNTKDLKNVAVFDDERSRYLVMVQGLDKEGQRINDIFCHVEILTDGIILIMENNSDEEITEDLVKKGIKREEITNTNLLFYS
ncbi:element excision factor XisI family protein [Xanthocytophaga agilis]|uniref:Element excision factor XisI family protein n=1 Tax=Xanthocytophaga agilis TaxID=3048010 RepID=A0AAE3R425_9BACT|nr:element excision factor XisI family protein [Xanthocytophaga agilis]MDJ1502790.1 element excision factor XisI family protein [Xanthocytophaga agilis]